MCSEWTDFLLILFTANSASNGIVDCAGGHSPGWNYRRWHDIQRLDNWWTAETGWPLHLRGKLSIAFTFFVHHCRFLGFLFVVQFIIFRKLCLILCFNCVRPTFFPGLQNFRAEPRNLPFFMEFRYFHGILQKLRNDRWLVRLSAW